MTNNPVIQQLLIQHKEAERAMQSIMKLPDTNELDRLGYGYEGGNYGGPFRIPGTGDTLNKIPPAPMPGTSLIPKPNLWQRLLQALKIRQEPNIGPYVEPLDPRLKIKPGFI